MRRQRVDIQTALPWEAYAYLWAGTENVLCTQPLAIHVYIYTCRFDVNLLKSIYMELANKSS